MPRAEESTLSNQKRRTRKELLRAATRLVKQGRKPSLEEVAEEALVSRATIYRYFPNVDALLAEASLDVMVPDADELFAGDTSRDPVARLERADKALNDVILANEASLRMMLAKSVERSLNSDKRDAVPPRQNRRTPLIEAALEPARNEFADETLEMLTSALALVIGTEAMVVCKDVLQLDDTAASKVRQWAIRAFVNEARR